MADLVKVFSEEGVNGRLLFNLSDGDLKDLGVVSGFSRRKIITRFKEYLEELRMKQLQ